MRFSPDGRYLLDPPRSRLGFKATAFLLMPVTGTLEALSGELTLEGGKLSATGVAAARTVSTGIRLRDTHLRHEHYLGAIAHPHVKLSLVDGPATGGAALATLTARGNTVPVPLTIDRVDASDDEVRVVAHGTFDRKPLGMLPPLAGVARQIDLDLDLVFAARL